MEPDSAWTWWLVGSSRKFVLQLLEKEEGGEGAGGVEVEVEVVVVGC